VTVAELITLLQKQPQHLTVLVKRGDGHCYTTNPSVFKHTYYEHPPTGDWPGESHEYETLPCVFIG
jgi:hypothetical protein